MEKIKNNMIKILLVINLILGVLSTAGVTYLIINQSNGPKMGERMGGSGSMTPPQMNDSQNQQNSDNTSSSNL
ncbi:hypothetical protein [Bacillus massiliigorillae]|uniref:hypothetical protein n=1 Tax=Bacillus massiliigorillae TaxID=1243664 RepID=UPI0005A9C2CE|nr:hypothetical protein [Bacillus massiliigorillae]